MKKHIIKLTFIALAIFASSCDSYLDVNKDPNVLGDTDAPEILLPSAQVQIGNNLMGWDLGFGGAYWSEYWTQSYTASQFKTLCEYQETDFNAAYQGLTAGTLNDLKRIKTLSTDADNQGYYYIAEALSIYTWQIMTDLWGDIPYSEALKGDEDLKSPVFDSGSDIYADLLTRIDALLAIDATDLTIANSFDFIYQGDMEQWTKFATSLKLKLMIRLSETSGYNNAELVTFISNNSFLTSSAKIDGSYWSDDTEGKKHPMREFSTGGANYLATNVIGCKTFIDYLNTNNDPRIDALFTAPSGGHLGAFFGDFDSKKDSDLNGTKDEDEDYSEAIFTADMDLMIMSDWEVAFYIAEVYARANDVANAKMYYDMGVQASLAQNSITNNDIITTGYAQWVNGTVEENIKEISMQKWVANANYQHIESFLERNRTKYPAVSEIDVKADRNFAYLNFPVGDFTVSVNGRAKTNGNLPASPVYPSAVLNRNENAPSQKVDLLEKVWWNQKIGK
ncbi:SusD/RagB family nutrient-binding outer membrane lipoprotein [Lutibacter citreus]|uniref:SusD/RagB family nutrient-binding outer membrane lipoprotein n=1 Tax=Lutibacter citreus TaxID=2138210 RepID=UPI000DBE5F7E|nr:SusD/RagB family nutrient-binding outer membrane lipoprotein [Lutibacter citreus]